MPKAVKYGLFLGVLGIIVGLLLGLVNFITKPIIAKAEEEKIVSALNEVNSSYQWVASDIDNVYRVGTDNEGNIEVYVFKTSTKGYKSGELQILTFIASDKIQEVVILKMTDQTKGIGTKIANEDYLAGFKDRSVFDFYGKANTDFSSRTSVDVISGATYSSRGLVEALIIASNYYVNNVKGGNK